MPRGITSLPRVYFLLPSRRRSKMKPLCHRGEDGCLDERPVEHDLRVVETQYRIAHEREPGVLPEITTAARSPRMRSESVDLQQQAGADDTIDRVPIDDHLLPHLDADSVQAYSRERFDPRV